MRRTVIALAIILLVTGCTAFQNTPNLTTVSPSETTSVTSSPTLTERPTSASTSSPTQTNTNKSIPEVTLAEKKPVSEFKWQPPLNRSVATISVGGSTAKYGDSAHKYIIWNNASTNRTIAVVVRTPDTTVVNRTVRLPPNTVVLIDVREPNSYRTNIRLYEEATTISNLTIIDDRDNFDCNTKNVKVALLGDSRVGVSVDTTLVACGTTTG